MNEFKKEKKEYNFWHSPVSLAILFCILVVFVYNMVDLFKKERETAKKKELIQEQIDTLTKREKILSEDIKKLETEEGVEDIIREKYQVTKEGEKMVVIVDENEQTQNKEEESSPKHGFVNWFKSVFQK